MPEPTSQPPRDADRGAVWLAMLSALTVVAALVAGKAARDAILLSRFDVRWLPLLVGIAAVASFPVVLITGKLMARYGPLRLMPALNATSAAFAVGEWLLLVESPKPAAIVIFFHLSILGAVLVSGFWSIVNERFDVQIAKQHIGRIGMGATLGAIVGGMMATGTAVYLSPDTILLVLAALQLASAFLLRLFGGQPRKPVNVAQTGGTWSALGVVAKSRLLRQIAVVVMLGAVAACVMDYVFKASIASGSKSDLLRSLAVYYTVTSVITALLQIVIGSSVITRLGIPRSVATLPVAVTVFGTVALVAPSALTSALARGAEAVTRNSVYRAAYELLFAPLPDAHKRSTKVILDVGAERVGDMLGAQLVGAIVYTVAAPRIGLQIAVIAIGAITVVFALGVRRNYTHALEESLMASALDPAPAADLWPIGTATLGPAGDLTALTQLHIRNRRPRVKPRATELASRLLGLQSLDPSRIRGELAVPLEPELVLHALELLKRPAVVAETLRALAAVAPRCTGMLVDALLEQGRALAVRRQLPAILVAGEPELASWGLWRGLADPSFEVRYRCGAALARLAADGLLTNVAADSVYAAVKRELLVDREIWKGYQLDDVVATERSAPGLDHVFTVLGLVLPAEPLRIALHAVQTDDPALRGTAIEYLESILPADVRAQLWPFLEDAEPVEAVEPAAMPVPARTPRAPEEMLTTLRLAFPAFVATKAAKT